jgi:capsular polysaccharide transport system permease protein
LSIIKAFAIQKRVIHALILRETRTRFDRNKLGYLWALFEPITYILVLIAMFSTVGHGSPVGGDDTLPLFFLSGLIPWLLFSHTASKCMEGITSNRTLLAYPQVTPFDVIISRALLELATIIVVFTVVFLAAAFFGYSDSIDSFKDMVLALISIWLLAIGVGSINSSIKLYFPSYSQTYSAIQRPFFFASGIFFTAESLPHTLRDLVLLNPILHSIEWFRSAIFTTYDSQYVDKTYLLTTALVCLTIGLSAERVTRKYARQA